MAKQPGQKVRGSETGRPIMVLLDQLGQKWTLRILWELRAQRLTFRELQSRCENASPTIVNRRLKDLRELQLIDHGIGGYGYTTLGKELGLQLAALDTWSKHWAKEIS